MDLNSVSMKGSGEGRVGFKIQKEILHPETLERVITLTKILLTSVSEELEDSREILKGHLNTERHLLGTLQDSY